MNLIRPLFLLFIIFLSGCVTTPPVQISENNWLQRQQQIQSIKEWFVKGRMAIKTTEKNFSSNLSWHYQGDKQQFILYGAFGQTYAKLDRDKHYALLTLSEDEKYHSSDVETLLNNVLGYPLPIEHLRYWIMGLPYPGENSQLQYDDLGYLKTIGYKQWTITYKKYRLFDAFSKIYLPGKITVKSNEMTLQLSLRDWENGNEL